MKDELDRILDDALASYSAVEPRAGLAGRVMARVRSDGAVSRNRWLPFAVGAVLACLAVAVVIWHERADRSRVAVAPVTQAVMSKVEAPPPAPERVQTRVSAGRVKVARRIRSLPQREQFPSPAPLTAEERALVAFARQAPQEALKLVRSGQPLEIKEIEIRPLEIEGLETGESR